MGKKGTMGMSYAFTGSGQSLVRTALLNNKLTSLTVVIANAVNDMKKTWNTNAVTHLRVYY